MGITSKKMAIDMGTAKTRIYVPKKGVVINQPTVVAMDDENTEKIAAYGDMAAEMEGRSPDEVNVVRPIQSGVIANFGVTKSLLSQFIRESTGRLHMSKPVAMMTISSAATSTERKALLDASIESGLQQVHFIPAAVAAALGSGLKISEPTGSMIVDIGAGTIEIGAFSLGGVVAERSARLGGNNIDEGIKLMCRREHGVRISSQALLDIKTNFLNLKTSENNSKTITGQSIIQGTPKDVTLKQKQLLSYIEPALDGMARSIRRVLEQVPPDIVSDIAHSGATLSGGSSQLNGLSEYLSKKLNLAFVSTSEPEMTSIKGANLALTHLEDYRKSLLA